MPTLLSPRQKQPSRSRSTTTSTETMYSMPMPIHPPFLPRFHQSSPPLVGWTTACICIHCILSPPLKTENLGKMGMHAHHVLNHMQGNQVLVPLICKGPMMALLSNRPGHRATTRQ